MTIAEDLIRLIRDRYASDLSDEEFALIHPILLDTPYYAGNQVVRLNGFRRSRNDRWLGGVCGGLAQATDVEAWVWRMLFTLLFLFGGTGLVAYLLLWFFVPSE